MNVRPRPFLSILLSTIVLFLSSLHFFLLLPITSVMASFVFTSFHILPPPLPHARSTFFHAPSPSLLISALSLSAFHLSPTSFSSISPSALLHLPRTFQLDVSAPPGTGREKMDEVHSGFFSSRLFISISVCFKFHLN